MSPKRSMNLSALETALLAEKSAWLQLLSTTEHEQRLAYEKARNRCDAHLALLRGERDGTG